MLTDVICETLGMGVIERRERGEVRMGEKTGKGSKGRREREIEGGGGRKERKDRQE